MTENGREENFEDGRDRKRNRRHVNIPLVPSSSAPPLASWCRPYPILAISTTHRVDLRPPSTLFSGSRRGCSKRKREAMLTPTPEVESICGNYAARVDMRVEHVAPSFSASQRSRRVQSLEVPYGYMLNRAFPASKYNIQFILAFLALLVRLCTQLGREKRPARKKRQVDLITAPMCRLGLA
ncbi:hypothetical protein GALMADRAFT_216838 [Galerina marginata CBS 339.88]|uniref:Uncharacterized protein n=1 Tax=Galerina marginata (strain CBS 339.88) TaxID=685588 RepID=A0A067S7E2_GALM3|nr:hypothetical protein GALMADRAFT_216838 [Galerina marginata CBS 339.88]